jgi:hypothetical protein
MCTHIRRQRVFPFFETNDLDALGMLRELSYPPGKKAEYGIFGINGLRNNE